MHFCSKQPWRPWVSKFWHSHSLANKFRKWRIRNVSVAWSSLPWTVGRPLENFMQPFLWLGLVLASCSGLAPAVLSLQTKTRNRPIDNLQMNRTRAWTSRHVSRDETTEPRLARQLKTTAKKFYGLKWLQCHSARAVHGARRLWLRSRCICCSTIWTKQRRLVRLRQNNTAIRLLHLRKAETFSSGLSQSPQRRSMVCQVAGAARFRICGMLQAVCLLAGVDTN